jgi:protein disulfide-isomerase A6
VCCVLTGKPEDNVEDYNGGRDAQAFIDFINEKAGTQRELGGGLAGHAGRYVVLCCVARCGTY